MQNGACQDVEALSHIRDEHHLHCSRSSNSAKSATVEPFTALIDQSKTLTYQESGAMRQGLTKVHLAGLITAVLFWASPPRAGSDKGGPLPSNFNLNTRPIP